jgi:Ribosomal protein L44
MQFEATCSGTACHLQAKTTKKIVLRMQCSDCKQTCMKPIKVGSLQLAFSRQAGPLQQRNGVQHTAARMACSRRS